MPAQHVAPIDPEAYAPTRDRPLRAKLRHLSASVSVDPHRHPWAQVAMSATGVIRMTAGRSTFIVPPSRAVWIPPNIEHVVTVVEDADIRTLYVDVHAVAPDGSAGFWPQCRVMEVSTLLKELVAYLDVRPGDTLADERERCITALVLDELRRAAPVRLGIDLPDDKRLRQLCESMLDAPARWHSIDDWAREAGASTRTVARLFRSELGTSFVQWRQQVLLAHALSRAARKQPMAAIAAELGYSSASAFTAMVRKAVGQPPSRFFSTNA